MILFCAVLICPPYLSPVNRQTSRKAWLGMILCMEFVRRDHLNVIILLLFWDFEIVLLYRRLFCNDIYSDVISPARAKKFIRLIGDIIIHLFFKNGHNWNSLCLPRCIILTIILTHLHFLPLPPASSLLSPMTHDHTQRFCVEWILREGGQWHSFLMLFRLTNSFHWLPVLNFRPYLNEDFF